MNATPGGAEAKPAASDSQPGAGDNAKSDEGAASSQAGSKGESKSEDKTDNTLVGKGVKLTVQEQSEVWANLVGGGKRGTSYNGLTTGILDIDLEKAFGWQRAHFYVSGFDIHGHGPSRSLVGNNQLISNIEAAPSVKLYALWLDQRLPGRLSIRLGQEQVNDEFMVTAHGSLFLNASFGTPGLAAADWPSGGPSYPLASPFVRGRWRASDTWALIGGVYNADPAPPGVGDPQIRDRNGTAFRLNGHALSLLELQYIEDLDAPATLATAYKLGAWHHSGRFDDRRFDTMGALLASATSSGIARRHRGDFAIYGVIDQVLWRHPDDKERGIGAFLRIQAAPADRNLVNLSIDGGIDWNGPFEARPKDIAGIAFAYLGISPATRRFSRDLVAFGAATAPFASNETVIEASYKAVITDWLTLQPDTQYVLNPNAGMPTPFGPNSLPNAFIIGVRATIKFASS